MGGWDGGWLRVGFRWRLGEVLGAHGTHSFLRLLNRGERGGRGACCLHNTAFTPPYHHAQDHAASIALPDPTPLKLKPHLSAAAACPPPLRWGRVQAGPCRSRCRRPRCCRPLRFHWRRTRLPSRGGCCWAWLSGAVVDGWMVAGRILSWVKSSKQQDTASEMTLEQVTLRPLKPHNRKAYVQQDKATTHLSSQC